MTSSKSTCEGQLTPPEIDLLAANERVIERGIKSFVRVGRALMAIRDGKLYRSEYTTFEAYCQERWGFQSSRARQLIMAAETAESVTNVTLSNEAVARELSRVPKEMRQTAIDWAEDMANGAPVTASMVQYARSIVWGNQKHSDHRLLLFPDDTCCALGIVFERECFVGEKNERTMKWEA